MPEGSRLSESSAIPAPGAAPAFAGRAGSPLSFIAIAQIISAHRRFVLGVVGGMLLLCLIYCLIAPNQYESKARVALETDSSNSLSIGSQSSSAGSGAEALAIAQAETLAGVFRTDQLAWRVILDKKLYADPAFNGSFAHRFPNFKPDAADPVAEDYLLKRFAQRLKVNTVPHTLLVEIRFRSHSAALSADVVNALIRTVQGQEAERRVTATGKSAAWLAGQLAELKTNVDQDERKLAEFQRAHGVLIAPEPAASQQSGQHIAALEEVDELSRELVVARAERILREAQYRAAMEGDPELVLEGDARLQADSGALSAAAFKQIQSRRSDLEQEMTQLSLEHGGNFPRVVEIREQLADLDKQHQVEDAQLRESLHRSWQAAEAREQMVEKSLAAATGEGFASTEAAEKYQSMRQELDAARDVYLRAQTKLREAGLDVGAREPDLWVVDPAHPAGKPVAPDLLLYMAITFFAAVWLALGGALLMESLHSRDGKAKAATLLALLLIVPCVRSQAPSPNTSGVPGGLTHISSTPDTKVMPNPKDAPPVWNDAGQNGGVLGASLQDGAAAQMPGPIAPGDVMDVSEFHTPEFHTVARVSPAGTIVLPMIGEIRIAGLNEQDAERAIASALVDKGMLKHPQVFVLVTQFVGQEISVLGEVMRPGVYPFMMHHRLLDLIAEAQGMSANAGSVITIFHRDNTTHPQIVALAADANAVDDSHNPQLAPGDTVQVGRSGLVYVVGDVIRPGGFAIEQQRPLTVLQAFSLAWGPTQSAAVTHALLIREQKGGGRTVTTVNLKRMMHGQDPDLAVKERDILYVPDSTAKAVWNHSLEAIVQSTAGVGIYAGMVYSQRF